MHPAKRHLASTLIISLVSWCALPAIASSTLKLTCSISAITASSPNQQLPPALSLGQGSAGLLFQSEDYVIDLDNRTATGTIISNNTVVDSFAVSYLTREILNLTKVPLKVDTGARALVTIDRRTGQYAKKEWSIDSSSQVIGGFVYYVGMCGDAERSRF